MQKLSSGSFSEEKMRVVLSLLLFSLGAVALGTTRDSSVVRAGSGIKIGTNDRGATRGGSSGTGRVGSGVRIGDSRAQNGSTRQRTIAPTQTTPTAVPFTHSPAAASPSASSNITYLKVGMVVPYKSFGVREYTKAMTTALNTLQKSTRGPRLGLFQRYDIHVRIAMKELTPSPTGYIHSTCLSIQTPHATLSEFGKIFSTCFRHIDVRVISLR